jgi:isocitrate dehydrogenase (NAD+)
MLTGSLGMLPSASLGEIDARSKTRKALYEPVHGSAPDIAGKGLANPTALLLAAGLMLDHVGRIAEAAALRRAIDEALNADNTRTRDLGGSASTKEFAHAVKRRITG